MEFEGRLGKKYGEQIANFKGQLRSKTIIYISIIYVVIDRTNQPIFFSEGRKELFGSTVVEENG